MQTLGLKTIVQREQDGDFYIKIPEWIGAAMGELLMVQFDGETLTIRGA